MDNIVCLVALLLGFAIGYLYVKFKSRNLLTLEKVKADYVLISIFEDHTHKDIIHLKLMIMLKHFNS